MASKRTVGTRPLKLIAFFTATSFAWLVFAVGCSDASSSIDQPAPTTGINEAAVPENVTPTAACARYVIANCQRRNECLGTTKDCSADVADCPDMLFSDGSLRDAQTTWACAETLRTRSCEDLILSKNPSCVTVGTRKIGESCISAAQCESLACTGSPSTCGTCVKRQAKGSSCSADAPCELGLLCDPTTRTCIEPDKDTIAALLTTVPLELGDVCDGKSVCVDGAYCAIAEDQALGTCSVPIPIGEHCRVSKACVAGAYCAIESITCRAIPTAGQTCGTDNELNVSMWCDDNSYCSDETRKCTPLPAAESPCGTNERLGNIPVLCAAGTYCDNLVTPPTCKALASAGTLCTGDTCATDLSCLCDDVECTTRSCGIVREFGESCTKTGDHCMVQIGSCTEGICQPNFSQSIFATICTL